MLMVIEPKPGLEGEDPVEFSPVQAEVLLSRGKERVVTFQLTNKRNFPLELKLRPTNLPGLHVSSTPSMSLAAGETKDMTVSLELDLLESPVSFQQVVLTPEAWIRGNVVRCIINAAPKFQVMSCLAQDMKSYPDIVVLSLEEDRELQECLSRLETVKLELGEEDPNFFHALLDVANCLSYRGRYEEAWDKYNTVYTALEGNKEDTSSVIFAMCLPAFASCKPEILHAYIKIWQQRLSDPSGVQKSTVRVLPEIMTRLKNVGKKDQAIELYDQLYALLVADRGEAHPLTVSAQLTCHMLSKLEDELRHCDEIYFNVVSTRGESDPKALQILLHKAWRLWYLNRKMEALEIYDKVNSTAMGARGENDPHALRAQLHKAECWSELDARNEAWQLYLAVCQRCNEEPLPMPEEVADMQQIFRDLRRKIKTRQYGRDVPTTISESIHDLQ